MRLVLISSKQHGLNIMSDTTIEIEMLGKEVEVEVDYNIYGSDVPATYFEPAEYAEWEINHIYKFVNGVNIDISDIFTDEEHEKILEILIASFED